MPHIDQYFNVLDLFNETFVVLTVYTLRGFSATSLLDPAQQWTLGYITIAFIALVFVVNFVMMFVVTTARVKKYLRKRKAKKAREAAEEKTKKKAM